MPAPAALLPAPDRLPDPVIQSALAELLQLGLAVARVASHLAEAEDRAVGALAEAAAETTRAALAPSASLGDALQAGRDADSLDAARDAIAARVASITESFDKAARAVRRTAALQARLAEARPFHRSPPAGRAPGATSAPRPANDAERPERPDAPENGDELRGRPDADIVHDIHRDLAGAASATLPVVPPATTPAARPAPLRPTGRPPHQPPGATPPRRDFLPEPDS